jgi:hypothetical protein
MTQDSMESIVKSLVRLLVEKNYDEVVRSCSTSRLSALDLRNAIRDYGRTLTMPPDRVFETLEVLVVESDEYPTWYVPVDLWTEEEGRSDLTLELWIIKAEDQWLVELDDLHVL